MLIKSPKLLDILSFPKFPAAIEDYVVWKDNIHEIIYTFYLNVDIKSAIEKNALNLIVSLYNEQPVENHVTKNLEDRHAQKNKRSIEKLVRKQSTCRSSKAIARKKIDLSKYISNDIPDANIKRGQYLTRQQTNSLASKSVAIKANDPFTQNRSISFKPVIAGINQPLEKKKRKTDFDLSTTVKQGLSAKQISTKKLSKTLLGMNVDPASLTAKSKIKIHDTSTAINAADLLYTPPTALPNIKDIKVRPETDEISFHIRLDTNDVSGLSSFFLSVELENSSGVKISETSTSVNHSQLLSSFLTPNYAPVLSAGYVKPGVVSVTASIENYSELKKGLSRLKVFRRLAPVEGSASSNATPWKQVYDSTIDDTAHFVFKDNILTSSNIIYRAIMYGINEKPSEKFASCIVKPLSRFKAKQHGELTAHPRLVEGGSNTFVVVDVKDIPEDVVSVVVKRYDMTNSSDAQRKASKGRGFIYVGKSSVEQHVEIDETSSNEVAQFRDETAKPGKNYKYIPVGITKAGKEITGSHGEIEIPLNIDSPKIRMNISSPQYSSTSEGPAITLSLEGSFTDFGFSQIRNTLESSGQKNLFDNDLFDNRDKFESLINFLVERRNLKTGETESFGAYSTGIFVDNKATRELKNIKDLKKGTQYIYIITGLINTPESLFPDLVRQEVDTRTLLSFSRKVSKFRNPLATNKATLQATQRQKDKTISSALESNDPLIAGRTAVQITKEFTMPADNSYKFDSKIELNRDFNNITWRYSGNNDIDHFRIYVMSSGGKILLDTVHYDDTSPEFSYRHIDKDYDVDMKYMIQPINTSYEEKEPVYTKAVSPTKISSLALTSKVNKC